jgi:hypothetical protein
VVLVQVFRRDELKDCITEVLETLVVARRDVGTLVGEGAVGQRLAEQAGIAEGDPDALLQVVETAGRNLLLLGGTAAPYAGWGARYEPDFSCMYSQA